ncbi:protein translocase subunit SecDF [Williamwhitmania taraxaci]|uniref:Multifunctional fusion protein n=1 Tax=Williamwhitmania taraxaci TaxID=1640674 RepID=A0A1G6RQH8_9BACT|nr:protein translocase subunit SecDF [Williamwhitmania taraxaci]SDD06614.1 SecD/SecF fusion protein [Williamwhitmania taraxaci]
MQNKGAFRLLAVVLALVCLYQLSFTFMAKVVESKAKDYAKGETAYLDSISTEPLYTLFPFTYKECKEREINLGLDLKGGMNVTLEVSVEEIVRSLGNYSTDTIFNKAIALALQKQQNSQSDFVTLFAESFDEIAPNDRLARFFATFELKDRITAQSTNSEVIKVIRVETEGAIANSFNIIRNRIDRFGVAQPNIQRLENSGRILVELPGAKDPQRVRKLLQGTANLEFWETYEMSELVQNFAAVNAKIAELEAITSPTKVVDSVKTEVATPKSDSTNALLAQVQAKDTNKVSNDELTFRKNNPLYAVIRPQVNEQGQVAPGPIVGVSQIKDTAKVNAYLAMPQVKALFPADLRLLWSVKPMEGGKLVSLIAIKANTRDGRAPLDGGVITDAREEFGNQGGSNAEVTMVMDAEGSKTWARMTAANKGRCIAIVLDEYVYSFPTVNDEITGGRSQISGRFSIEEAKDLANVLKSGKLPAPARIIQEAIVGPSLGQATINSGMMSFLFSFILVLFYMVLYYSRRGGLIADMSLMFNLFILIGVLASFGAVLTLPGIAGIVLTMGMAVDANVLIFERIREEIRSGKGINLSITDGHKSAMSAIIDGNMTTLITAIVLYIFGSGPIRGFATTLTIGILTSLFSALVVSRLIIEYYVAKGHKITFSTKLSEGAFTKVHIKFIEWRKYAYAFSLSLILIFGASFAIRGLNPGIDFAGGRSFVVKFDQKVKPTEVAITLKSAFEEAPEVKTFGTDNQVKITTKYRIKENGTTVDNEVDVALFNGLKAYLPADLTFDKFDSEYKISSDKVGPTVADDIRRDAIIAVIFSLLAIFIYIFIRFKNLSYGLGGIASLAHDAIIVIGVYSLFYHRVPFALEVDQAFIAAVLTIIGYSINDTVIIFDRIREYISLYPKRERKDIIDAAMNDTLSRTFSTSFTTFIVLIPMFFFAGEVIRGFIFGLIIGIFFGSFSSVFVATPIAYDIARWREKRAAKKLLAKK